MRRAILVTGVAALLLSLSGCITIQIPERGAPETVGPATTTVVCKGQETTTLTDPTVAYVLTGTCHDVAIEGEGISLTAEEIRNFAIRGEGNVVTIQKFTTLTIEGQANTVEVTEGGDAIVKGQNNTLHSTNDLDAVIVTGAGNEVTADGFIASLDVTGDN